MLKAIQRRLRNKKGFTLIELIVVIAVLGILASISIPRLVGVTSDAKYKADVATAAHIAKAAQMYYTTRGEAPTLQNLIDEEYIDSTTPKYADKISGITFEVEHTSGGIFEVNYKDDDGKFQVYPETEDNKKPPKAADIK